MRRLAVVIVAGAALLAGCGHRGGGSERASTRAEVAALRPSSPAAAKLLAITEEYWDRHLELNPLEASAEGDHRYDARFGDYVTLNWMADSLAIEQEALERLGAVKVERLGPADRVTLDAFRYGREIAIEGFRFPSELLPLQPYGNFATGFALAGSGQGVHPFRTTADYDHFLSRMDGFVEWVDHAIASMRAGMEKGVVQPRVVVERTIPVLDALVFDDPKQSPFWRPILSFPAGMPVADRTRLVQAYSSRLSTGVLPAYRRLRDFVKNEYLPKARAGTAFVELPNGAAWYAWLVRISTGTSLTPAEVHALGESEVARLRPELERLARQAGHAGDLRSFLDVLRADPRFQPATPADLVADYAAQRRRIEPALPLLFARVPKSRLEIRPMEPWLAAAGDPLSYVEASADAQRPGVLWIDAATGAAGPAYAVESRFLQWGLPGRHLQSSDAAESTLLPRFRRFGHEPAYVDGWALYATTLGRDLGLYADLYAAIGAASTEMQHAAMLVVDTGIHSQGWKREKAVDYLLANTALTAAQVDTEVDRCIALPARALSHQSGLLAFRRMRQAAQQSLGPRFDLRAFHAQVLDGGVLPLAVLEAHLGN